MTSGLAGLPSYQLAVDVPVEIVVVSVQSFRVDTVYVGPPVAHPDGLKTKKNVNFESFFLLFQIALAY